MLVERETFGGIKTTKHLYSPCSQYILYGTTTGILVFSNTGFLIHKIDIDHVKSLQMNPKNPVQVYCCTVNTVFLYDFTLGIQIQSWELEEQIENLYIHDSKFYLLTRTIIAREIEQQQVQTQVTIVKQLYLPKKTTRDVFFIDHQVIKSLCFIEQKCIVVLQQHANCFYIADLITGDIERIASKYPVNTCAVYPKKQMAAIGDVKGRILLFYNVLNKNRTHSVMHWHAYKVYDLEFSHEGSYLLSGGNEATVVIWQIETGHKQFLPRLGGEISQVHVSPDEKQYAIGLLNNSILLVSSADVSQRNMIDGIHQAHLDYNTYPPSVGLLLDPKTGNICMNGSPSTLQFLNPKTGQTAMVLRLSDKNRITFGKDVTLLPHITHSVFSPKGDWLVTVDKRDVSEKAQESFLKFWEFDEQIQEYVLNSRVDLPHKNGVTGLAFCPSTPGKPLICATTGLDGSFKIWELFFPSDREDTKHWRCRSMGSFKSFMPNNVEFSEDGSTLAVGFDNVISLWDPFENQLKKTLLVPGPRKQENIVNMTFVDFHLVVWTKNIMHVWSLLSCSILWSLKTKVQNVIKDPYGSKFACSVLQESKGCVYVFDPISPIPLQTLPMNSRPFGIVYLPTVSRNASLVYLDRNFELHRFTVEDEFQPKQNLPKIQQSLFVSMYGHALKKDASKVANMEKVNPKSLEFLEIPAHILPLPTKLADSFLDGFLNLKAKDIEHVEEMDQDTLVVDSDMGLDVDPPPLLNLDFLNDHLAKLVLGEERSSTLDSIPKVKETKEIPIDSTGNTKKKKEKKQHSNGTTPTNTVKHTKAPQTPTPKGSKKRSHPNT